MTTAESLVVRVLVTNALLAQQQPEHYSVTTTFPKQLWIRPQLDALADKGLVSWRFAGDEPSFEVTPTEELLRSQNAPGVVLQADQAP